MRSVILLLMAGAMAFGQGTLPAPKTWTNTNVRGYPSTAVGYDKAVWVDSRQAMCYQTNYLTRGVTSEVQDAVSCYNYETNWMSIVEQGGGAHSIHSMPGGHSVSVVDYYKPADAFVINVDNSYGNTVEVLSDWWVWYAGSMTFRDAPMPTHSSNAGNYTRVWLSPSNQLNAGACNQNTGKCLIYNDYRQGAGGGSASICSINNAGILTSCAATSTVNIPGGGVNSHNIVWNPDDGLFYLWGHTLTTMTTYNDVTDTWTPLTTSCIGADCVSTHPIQRWCAGMAYSTADHVLMLAGGRDTSHGCSDTAGTGYTDTFTFNPETKTWTELCGPGMTACGYPNPPHQGIWDKLVYDPLDNIFVYLPYNGNVWVYALSTPLAFGRTAAAFTPPAGSLNRTSPGTNNTIQGNSFDTNPAVAGGVLYIGHTETDQPNGTSSNCKIPTAYLSSVDSNNVVTHYPGGTTIAGCNAIRYGEAQAMPMSHTFPLVIGGTKYLIYEKHNYNGFLGPVVSKTWFQQNDGTGWNGGWTPQAPGGPLVQGANTVTLSPFPAGVTVGTLLQIAQISTGSNQSEYVSVTGTTASTVTFTSNRSHTGTWTIGPSGMIGCFSKACGSVIVNQKVQSYPTGLANVGGVVTTSVIEEDTSVTPFTHKLFVAQYVNGAFAALGGALNNATAYSHVTYASQPASDGSGNIAQCWTEQVNGAGSKITLTTQPKLYCKLWNGTSWSQMGAGALNQVSANWAYLPSVLYHNGSWYAAYTESTQGGNTLVYVLQYNGGANSWTVVGDEAQNINPSTGIAYHPTLATDGTLLYLGWEEQRSVSDHAFGHVKTWNGMAWKTLGDNIAADTSDGSVQNVSVAVVGNTPAVVFEEIEYGNLRQVYRRLWTGSSWSETATPSCTIMTTSVPSGVIGAAYSQQVNTADCAVPAFTVSSGSLPAGLSMSNTGLISGTPTTAVTGAFTVSVADANGNATQALSITVNTPDLFVPITVQELICSGCSSGIARSDEPLVMGFPLPDAQQISNTSTLNLIGASAAQFSVEGTWPSGNLKWVKVRAIVPSVSAGGTAALTLTDSGAGNFGGSDLAVDNGTTITVATGAATFTVKKANFNVIDQAVVGSTTLVASGTSQGIVVVGPDATAAYPGNVTCSPTPGGSACTTQYTTSNDSGSTCSIEENGPAMAGLKCTADLNDGAGHVYMHTTTRLHFYKGKTSVKAAVILRNADIGSSYTFATATKGHQGFELRIKPNLSGTLTYTIANHTANPTTGTLNPAGGTDSAYIYQANSNLLKQNNQCTSPCVLPSTISGYAIVANGAAVLTGTASQYPVGWAEISDASNNNVVIGYEQFAGYGNKSLEFQGGGTDVRIGMWAAENNSTSPSTTTANAPYYQAWPQYSIHNVFLEFNTSQPTSAANDFLKFQYPLVGRADYSWYNQSAVFPYPMLSAAEENAYYADAFGTASPSVTARAAVDLPIGNTTNADILCQGFVCVFPYYNWAATGGGNQMEFRLAHLFDFIRRGFTGGYLKSSYFYKFMAEWAFPRSDGFSWSTQSATQYYDYPTATSTNSALTTGKWNMAHGAYLENDSEHANGQGLPEYYFLSGDETIKEAAQEYADMYLNTVSTSNYASATPTASIWNDRALGNVLFAGYELYNFLQAIGDGVNAATIKTNMENVYVRRMHPALCSYPGYPAGCTPDTTDSIPQVGTSLERGLTSIFKDTSVTLRSTCNGIIPASSRTAVSFMSSRKLEGLYLLHQMEDASWPYYWEEWDRAYGSAQWAFGEMYNDNGTANWNGNGFRYKQAVDYPNSCNTGAGVAGSNFDVGNNQTIWFNWFVKGKYEGALTANDQRQIKQMVQTASGVGAYDELFHFTVGTVIDLGLHPPTTATLRTLPITGFTDNGAGSYTLSWTVPPGPQSYRVKWGAKRIVDWIGFNAATYSWIGDPATTQNWFASTDAAGIPAPATPGTTQSFTVATGTAGLTAANFMVKGYAAGDAISNSSGSTRPVLSGKTLVGGKIVK